MLVGTVETKYWFCSERNDSKILTHTHTPHTLTPLSSLYVDLSQEVVDAGAVPLLVLCIQEPEVALKRIAASALSDIAKHSPELAQTVVDTGAIAHLAQMILNPDAKLKVRGQEH